jgi:hypothetical protein
LTAVESAVEAAMAPQQLARTDSLSLSLRVVLRRVVPTMATTHVS